MIPTKQFCNKLSELGYYYKTETSKVRLWRLRGGTRIVPVPKKDLIPEAHVRSQLRQCGLSPEKIEEFLKCVVS